MKRSDDTLYRALISNLNSHMAHVLDISVNRLEALQNKNEKESAMHKMPQLAKNIEKPWNSSVYLKDDGMDNRTFTHQVLVGDRSYKILVLGRKEKDTIYFDTKDLIFKQKELAKNLLEESREFDRHLFNFSISASGLRAKEIASILDVQPATISQIRREKADCSNQLWKWFRVAMISTLSEN